MKQKAIVRVSIVDEKSRKKALKTVVGHSGVVSACLQEKDKNLIEVVGEGIDSVVITKLLRKCLGFAELMSLSPIPEKKEKEGGDGETKDKAVTPVPAPMFCTHYPYNGWGGHGYVEVRDDPTCNIM